MQNIILFGEMGSGKSEVAKYLEEKYNYTILSLGSKIHSECRLHGNETREEMQNYGQMMRKIFGESVWCDYLYLRSKNYKKIVIDDARQTNEFNYFTNNFFMPVAVIADEQIRIERLKKRVNYVVNPDTSKHETEVQARLCIEKCDIKIYNNYSMTENLAKEIEEKLKGVI